MKIAIDTKEDSHEEIKKVIRMLQNLVGDSEEIFTNQPISESINTESSGSAFSNIFGDAASPETSTAQETTEATQETKTEEAEESSESTEDLFAELFSEEELKKMDEAKVKEEEKEESKPKGKKFSIELY